MLRQNDSPGKGKTLILSSTDLWQFQTSTSPRGISLRRWNRGSEFFQSATSEPLPTRLERHKSSIQDIRLGSEETRELIEDPAIFHHIQAVLKAKGATTDALAEQSINTILASTVSQIRELEEEMSMQLPSAAQAQAQTSQPKEKNTHVEKLDEIRESPRGITEFFCMETAGISSSSADFPLVETGLTL